MKSKWYKKESALIQELKSFKSSENEILLWFLGQSGFAFRLGTKMVLIDTMLNDLTDDDGKSQRNYEPPFSPQELHFVDYYIATHEHADHMPLPTILALEKSCPEIQFIIPAPLVCILIENGVSEDKIIPAYAEQTISLNHNEIEILPLASAHTEYEQDKNDNHYYLGYIFKYNNISIYHPGDTIVTEKLVVDLQKNKPIHIALLPINGQDWERTRENIIGNMNARDAVMLAENIPFDLTIPCHYDMFFRNGEDPAIFSTYMYSRCPEKKFHIMALGECFIYKIQD